MLPDPRICRAVEVLICAPHLNFDAIRVAEREDSGSGWGRGLGIYRGA